MMSVRAKNLIILFLAVTVAILATRLLITSLFTPKDHSSVDSTIVVERIQKVMKLITVEGNYSELMKYTDFSYIDFPGFRKDALLRVNARVSVGYNLDNLKISSDEKSKTILIQDMPEPEILSVDTDIKFENLSTGIFTGFSEAELTKLNALAKENIRKKALSQELIRQAEEQKADLFDLLFYMAKGNGYKIIIEGKILESSPAVKNTTD
jgi:hypothetical protein